MRVRTWPVVGVVFAVLWVFVVGQPLTPISLVRGFLSGLLVGLPVAFVFRRLYGKSVDLGRGVRALPYAGLYLGAFTWELLRANLDVAYRVLSPGMPIEPEVILVPLRVESDVAITVIANSITITPGTVTLDYDEETNALYVHGVNGRHPEAIAEPIRTWENYALELFDEDASPSDPPPDIVVSGGERDRGPDRQPGGVDDD
ncbi:Na+/H+ antiporter subunit E [Natrinema altunense]|uniref:Cation antiporter n=1 Tax=Natrinema altunense (strain JCM 12890 / CGMCC 1.3731 / AJ2) TaxID=1227494 RepID=L9ZL26_NATA2|nr:Na+/H+ antiporter subunit E [Natrinema altunense]ELY85878.1 cation antiporter [Natrinema altunense JCM 12890]